MSKLNSELKRLMKQITTAQKKVQATLEGQGWWNDARKYAATRGKEVKKLIDLFDGDVKKVKAFVEREKREFDRIQQVIPAEVKKLKTYVDGQRKEVQKLIKNLKTKAKKRNGKSAKAAKAERPTAKKAAPSPESATVSAPHSAQAPQANEAGGEALAQNS